MLMLMSMSPLLCRPATPTTPPTHDEMPQTVATLFDGKLSGKTTTRPGGRAMKPSSSSTVDAVCRQVI